MLPRSHRFVTWFVIFVAASTAAGCARTHLFYDAREMRHTPLAVKNEGALAEAVASKIGGRTVVWRNPDGTDVPITTDAKGLAKLPTAELGALWLATSNGDVGGESDLRVRVAGRKETVPVTVFIALDGTIRVESAPKGGARRDDDLIDDAGDDDGPTPTLSEAEIRDKYGLAYTLPGKWKAAERRALVASFDALTPEELNILRSVGFVRQAAPRGGDSGRAALYELSSCKAIITLYSSGVKSDKFRFVGDVGAPRSATLHSIVHEMGHAFEAAAARDKFCEAERNSKNVDKRNELVREGNALMSSNPVLDAYVAALAGQPAPTDYGNTSHKESFAESFALFHVDPQALKRTRPAIYEWFAAREHVKALPELKALPKVKSRS